MSIADPGRDLACVDDLDAALRETTGVVTFQHALARRISTPRGAVIDDDDYGIDIRDELKNEVTRASLVRIAGRARNEILKDERAATCSVTPTAIGSPLVSLALAIGGDAAEGPYSLTVAVDAVKVSLLGGS